MPVLPIRTWRTLHDLAACLPSLGSSPATQSARATRRETYCSRSRPRPGREEEGGREVNPLDVRCPFKFCQSDIGDPCSTVAESGPHRGDFIERKPHAARIKAAEKAAKKETK